MTVEIRLRSSAVASEPTAERREIPGPGSGWLVGPWFDALFVANLAWPLLLLAPLGEDFGGRTALQFWQIYFVTTPHRWITLPLVFLDRERFRERKGVFLALAIGITAACLAVRLTTGTLTCLLAIDYVWNAWHFAAQHHGVYRIYGRLSEPRRTTGLTAEKWAMRLFLCYVALRVAGATWSNDDWERQLRTCDWIAAAVLAWLVASDISRARAGSLGRITYLASVSALYMGLLWAVRARQPELVLSLTLASALFHAIEYLSLVGWSVRGRHAAAADRLGLLAYLAPRWTIALGAFVLILGTGGWLMDRNWMKAWLLINVVVAFLHYAYDGLIWRRPPGAARALASAGAACAAQGGE